MGDGYGKIEGCLPLMWLSLRSIFLRFLFLWKMPLWRCLRLLFFKFTACSDLSCLKRSGSLFERCSSLSLESNYPSSTAEILLLCNCSSCRLFKCPNNSNKREFSLFLFKSSNLRLLGSLKTFEGRQSMRLTLRSSSLSIVRPRRDPSGRVVSLFWPKSRWTNEFSEEKLTSGRLMMSFCCRNRYLSIEHCFLWNSDQHVVTEVKVLETCCSTEAPVIHVCYYVPIQNKFLSFWTRLPKSFLYYYGWGRGQWGQQLLPVHQPVTSKSG